MNIKELEATLKPCPWCGERATFTHDDWRMAVGVHCCNLRCGVYPVSEKHGNHELAAKAWNERK